MLPLKRALGMPSDRLSAARRSLATRRQHIDSSAKSLGRQARACGRPGARREGDRVELPRGLAGLWPRGLRGLFGGLWAPAGRESGGSQGLAGRPVVLVVDDDAMVRMTLRAVLEDAGCEVILAPGGPAGLALARERKPDLIITDIIMPEMDGLEVIRSVRATAAAPPIIAMSGGARINDQDNLARALSLGAAAVLEKPFEPEEVVAAVQALLDRDKCANTGGEP